LKYNKTPTPVITETKLAQATRHVAEGKRIVAKQREIIARQKRAGADTTLSEELLAQFERTLVIFETDLQAIQED
jgi:hypothetical protein